MPHTKEKPYQSNPFATLKANICRQLILFFRSSKQDQQVKQISLQQLIGTLTIQTLFQVT